MPLDTINQLEDHDLTYLYVESVFDSSVVTNSILDSEEKFEGRASKIKSYLGSAEKLKAKAEKYQNFTMIPN